MQPLKKGKNIIYSILQYPTSKTIYGFMFWYDIIISPILIIWPISLENLAFHSQEY